MDHETFFLVGKRCVTLRDLKLHPEADLALGMLDPFDPKEIGSYPVFKDPAIRPGTSLCRLGFPFHEIKASFNETNNSFQLDPEAIPLPFFPIEGIFTRNIIHGKSKDGKYIIKFLETSFPGLKGQSGGPILDVNGTIWSIQSRTNHLLLGFRPKIKNNGKEIEENQFLNVGLGIHPELLISFLQENNINFAISTY